MLKLVKLNLSTSMDHIQVHSNMMKNLINICTTSLSKELWLVSLKVIASLVCHHGVANSFRNSNSTLKVERKLKPSDMETMRSIMLNLLMVNVLLESGEITDGSLIAWDSLQLWQNLWSLIMSKKLKDMVENHSMLTYQTSKISYQTPNGEYLKSMLLMEISFTASEWKWEIRELEN